MSSAAKSSTVQSLQRALLIMNALSSSPAGLSLKDLAEKTGLPSSTAHRLLATLSEQGYVQSHPSGQRWRIGVQAFSVGQSFLAGRDLIEIARAPMVKLMEETQETVKMGLLSGDEVVILTQSECSQSMRAFAEPGARLPLYCTSLGKALLAPLGKEAALDLVGDQFQAQTAKTLPDFKSLWAQISSGESYAIQDEEYLAGLRGAAACIYDEHGVAAAALSVTGPSVRIPAERLSQLGTLIASVCEEITQAYGGKQPATAQAA